MFVRLFGYPTRLSFAVTVLSVIVACLLRSCDRVVDVMDELMITLRMRGQTMYLANQFAAQLKCRASSKQTASDPPKQILPTNNDGCA